MEKLRPEPEGAETKPRSIAEPWPTYGYDAQRTHLAPLAWRIRPPYYGIWKFAARAGIEFPPSVAYGKYLHPAAEGASTSSTLVAASASGCGASRTAWLRRRRSAAASSTRRSWTRQPCAASTSRARVGSSSPGTRTTAACSGASTRGRSSRRRCSSGTRSTSARGTTSSMRSTCGKKRQSGALDVRDRRPGHRRAGVRERDGLRRHERGQRLRLNARTGRMRWHATSFSRFGRREYFYATPAVAYGRVFLGNTDGTVYAYGATTGHLLWARRRRDLRLHGTRGLAEAWCIVGTWDGYFVSARRAHRRHPLALRRPRRDHGRANRPGRPRLLLDLRSLRRRRPATGRRSARAATFALNARNGEPRLAVPRRASTRRSSPTAGGSTSPGKRPALCLHPGGAPAADQGGAGAAKRARSRRAKKRARCRSKAKRGTSSAKPGSRKSSTNIEIANPAAPAQSVAARRWLHRSHAVSGSQRSEGERQEGVVAEAVVDDAGVEQEQPRARSR